MTRMTASEAFVETLVAQGVKDVFGIVGSAYMDALDLFPAAGIRFIPTVHEQGAGHMADGYSRASGRHGVCIAQNGPGHHQLRDRGRRRLLGALARSSSITPETGSNTHGPGRLPGDRQLPIFSERSPNIRRMCNASGAHCRAAAALLRHGDARARPRPSSTSRATISTARPTTRSRRRSGSALGRAADDSLDEAAELLAKAQVPGDRLRRRRHLRPTASRNACAGRAARRPGRQQLPAQ